MDIKATRLVSWLMASLSVAILASASDLRLVEAVKIEKTLGGVPEK